MSLSDIISLLLISIALAMDSFTVSLTIGAAQKKFPLKNAVILALIFGGGQCVFPWIGWILGVSMYELINTFDHWIAFFLLFFVGIKMIRESFHADAKQKFSLEIPLLILLGTSVSIDALAIGLSFALLRQNILLLSIFAGIISFIFSLVGIFLGKKVGFLFGKRAEFFGGLILIGIGLNILREHLA
ncbi:manganese efflux pump [Candidatus Peregrinibacteria bacterium]|nr:manganese efflux pump [Candidatus Peregrinibacteria bacterium]